MQNNFIVKNTMIFSFFIQIVTLIIGVIAQFIKVPNHKNILKNALLLENIVQFIEATFYLWFIYFYKNNVDKVDIAKYRFYDWFLTTPTMILSIIIYFHYNNLFDPHTEEVGDIHFEEDLHNYCFSGMHAQHQTTFASNYLDLVNVDSLYQEELIEQSIKRLVLHEVGHTLGLNHNFKGSTLLSISEIKDQKIVLEKGLCNSVMEYPAINIASNIDDQTLYYDTVPGLYDHWAIEFGYSTFSDSLEKDGLQKILSKSINPDLAFANDADDMRYPGKGIDPFAMINDLTNEPVQYSVERMDLIISLIYKIKDKYSIEDESFQRLKNAFSTLLVEYRNCLSTISRQIGGVEVNRSFFDPKKDQAVIVNKPQKPDGYQPQDWVRPKMTQ